MLDEIDAEKVTQSEYETQYTTLVDHLVSGDYSEGEGSYCIAEPSFCGFLLTVSMNKKDWEDCYALWRSHGRPLANSLEVQIGVWIDSIVDAFSVQALTRRWV